MRVAAVRDARGGSHSLSRTLGKALEVVELWECLDIDVVHRRWVLNLRALELRGLDGLEALGTQVDARDSKRMPREAREGARPAGSTVL